jgi:hypothetical protein
VVVSSAAAPAPVQADDDDDDLPRPGKVWDDSGPSLVEQMKAIRESVEAAAPQIPPAPASNVETVQDLPGFWKTLIGELSKAGPGLPSLLSHARPQTLDGDRLVIRYSAQHDTMPKMLERNGKKDALRQMASTLAGRPLSVVIEVDPPDANPPAPAAPTAPQPVARRPAPAQPPPPQPAAPVGQPVTPEMAEELKAKHPLVKALVEQLGAVPVRQLSE